MPVPVSAIQLVGGDNEIFQDLLPNTCFTNFKDSSKECRHCICVVLVQGRLQLMRDVCRAASAGGEYGAKIQRLTAGEVEGRLEAGDDVHSLFKLILNGLPAEEYGKEARVVLYDRLYYLRTVRNLPVPKLPPLKELTE